jgi:glycosyl transferase family 25
MPRQAAWDFLNGWADRVVVVTLPRAKERQERIRGRLAGLDFRFVDGVDKRDLDRATLLRDGAFDERRAPRAFRPRGEMNLGEVGAALAHRRIYDEMIANGWRRVVVFEDDIVAREPDLAHLPRALAQLPDDFELCYLGYLRGERTSPVDRAKQAAYVALAPLRLVRWSAGEALRLHPSPYSPNLRRAGFHLCTHAYAVSLAGARKLAAAQTPVAFRADWLFIYLLLRGELRGFVTEPKLFDQESFAGVGGTSDDPESFIRG